VGLNLVKAVSRAVGLPDKVGKPLVTALFPALAVTDVAVGAVTGVVGGLAAPHQSAPVDSGHSGYYPVTNQYIQPGSYPQQQPYQLPFSDYNSPVVQQGGYPSWEYSTPSQGYLIQQPQTFQAPSTSASRSWEDLIAGAALFL